MSRSNRRAGILRCVVLLLLLAGAAVPARAQGLITPGVGVGDLRIGDTTEQLIELLGKPELEAVTDTVPKANVYQYYKRQITVLCRDGKVSSIMVLNSGCRTQNGVGVGSSISEVESALGSDCERKQGNVGPEYTYASGIRILFLNDRAIGVEVRGALSSRAAGTPQK